jgi:hypothetical protein
MAEQSKETLAAGEPPDVADQREAELLNELRESLPELKSNAGKFTKLSDSFSSAEGEFVQEVFEPEVSRSWRWYPSPCSDGVCVANIVMKALEKHNVIDARP